MEEIRELVSIVLAHTKKNLPLIDLKAQEDNDNKELNLFLGIKNGKYNSDSEASLGVYGTEEVDFKFRMLKSRLNRKLLNHLFFMDFIQAKLPKHVTIHQECLDYVYFSKMLLKIGEEKYATKLLYKVLDQAKEYEYTDIVLEIFNELRQVYASTFRPKLYQNTREQINKYKDLLIVEEEANNIFFDNKLALNSTINNRKKDLKPVLADVDKLYSLYKETNSFNIFIKFLKLKFWHLELTGDYEGSLDFITEIEKLAAKGSINLNRFNGFILEFARVYAYLKLNKFDEGIQKVEEQLDKVESDSLNWFTFIENYFLLIMHKGDYEKGGEIIMKVITNKAFPSKSSPIQNRWDIYRAYTYLMTGNKKLIKKLNLETIINEIPQYAKENAPENVAILILQSIFKITDSLDDLHISLKALNDYTNKFLNNSFSKRSKVFVKLLNKIATHNRDLDLINSKSKYLVEKLKEMDPAGEEFVDMEIVPYERLWTLALERVNSYNLVNK